MRKAGACLAAGGVVDHDAAKERGENHDHNAGPAQGL